MYCKTLFPFSASDVVAVSPDLGSIAVHRVYDDEIQVAPLSSRAAGATRHPFGLRTSNGALASNNFGRRPLRWSNDSKTLWSAKQERASRVGQAVSPVRPIRIENGVAYQLPDIRHPVGVMDTLLWAADGRALALFGTGTDYYVPVPNPDPSFAFVDAVNGRVLETLPLREVSPAGDTPSRYSIRGAEVVARPDGRLRAFIRTAWRGSSRWTVWTQGESPRFLSDPYPVSSVDRLAAFTNFNVATAISADGARLLIARNLRPEVVCIEPATGCRPASPPVEGVLAALHDLETGATLWSYRARSTNVDQYARPELSDDGQYALIGLPASGTPPKYSIALLSPRDGSVQQLFRLERESTMGFARNSRSIWITEWGGGITAVYSLR